MFLIITALLAVTVSFAQTPPQMIITWVARQDSSPSSFPGKILPTQNSVVTASLEFFVEGKPASLSEQKTYWYVNDGLVASGMGIKRISFLAPAAGSIIDLRVQLPNYNGSLLTKTIQIPVATPLAVINAPYPNKEIFGRTIALKGIPYFFSAKSSALNFRWSVNGSTPENTENPSELNVNLNPDALVGSNVNISLTISNPANPGESASQNISLKLK